MGQLVEWPAVITEGKTLDECRAMLEDALHEMIAVCKEDGLPIPSQLLPSFPSFTWERTRAGNP
jgi:predicted RNase H-like HicB family nuclease